MGMLCLPCAALFQGVGSGIWAWAMDATGAAAKTWKTTAPLFQEAFYYGAINGATSTIVWSISKTIKEKVTAPDNTPVHIGWDFITRALCIASRYGTAHLCNQAFGTKITTSYVHSGTMVRFVMAGVCASSSGIPLRGLDQFL